MNALPFRFPRFISLLSSTVRLAVVVSAGLLASALHAGSGSSFIAVGADGVILTSSDASSWTRQSSGTPLRLRSVAGRPGLVVAVGESGTILTSPDGSVWTASNSGVTETLRGVVASPTAFVAVGGRNSSLILTSNDGSVWTQATVGTTGKLRAVTWSGASFFAVGDSGLILTSPDGITWVSAEVKSSENFVATLWTGTQFWAISSTAKVVSSPNGRTGWKFDQASAPMWIEGITFTPDLLVAVGSNGSIQTSVDGHKWSSATSGVTTTLHGAMWTGNLPNSGRVNADLASVRGWLLR